MSGAQWHQLATDGGFSFKWQADADSVTLFHAMVPDFRMDYYGDMTLADVESVLTMMLARGVPHLMDATAWRFLVERGQCIETWLDTAPHDLARYGEVGVSY